MKKATVMLDRPIFIAFTVLELSKLFMYDWHYDKIKNWYQDKASLLYTDTDSLAYKIETNNLFKDLNSPDRFALFDFSNYDEKSFVNGYLHSNKNKKMIGKMKDEAGGKIIYSFIGIAPKMYSMEGENDFKVRKAKGIKKQLIERQLKHQHFKKTLFKQKVFTVRMNLLRSKKHKLYIANFKKRGLTGFDSKRYILSNGVQTSAHFNCMNELNCIK